MKFEEIKTIVVIGSGNMGRQIALNIALHGYRVIVHDVSEAALEGAKNWTGEYLAGRVAKGRMTRERVDEAEACLTFEPDFKKAAEQADVVIEAAIENLEAKKELFQNLDIACPPHTILATNSSSIVSSKLASMTGRPDRVLNMHYFNPAMVMELVEVAMNPWTSEESAQMIMQLCRSTGKTPILLRKEIRSFVVNRLMDGIFKEAFYLLDQGVATVEEIDIAAEKGLKHPMGPFKLLDQIGIDVSYTVRAEYYKETGDEANRPSHILEDKVKEGKLGRKTGEGFYQY